MALSGSPEETATIVVNAAVRATRGVTSGHYPFGAMLCRGERSQACCEPQTTLPSDSCGWSPAWEQDLLVHAGANHGNRPFVGSLAVVKAQLLML